VDTLNDDNVLSVGIPIGLLPAIFFIGYTLELRYLNLDINVIVDTTRKKKANEKEVCKKCGKVEKDLNSGLCDKCHGQQWDKGFETTSEWGEDVTFGHHKLELRKEGVDKKVLSGVAHLYKKGRWSCRRCGAERLSEMEKKLTNKKRYEVLSRPCKCGAVGFLDIKRLKDHPQLK
jgi:hypothetical protein